MDRWALEQAVEMLEAKAEQGQLSPDEEQRIRELLADGDATSALATLADYDDDSEMLDDAESLDYAD